jgi:hypothetical protein
MRYRGGYKYQLAADERFHVAFRPRHDIVTPRIWLTTDGTLTVRDGYAWDGVSGPVIDRKTNMRASLCHDALYQLMRMTRLPCEQWRIADGEFARLLNEDGAWPITRRIDMFGLKLAGGRAALPKNRKKVYEAP